jgi:hypothetical protein
MQVTTTHKHSKPRLKDTLSPLFGCPEARPCHWWNRSSLIGMKLRRVLVGESPHQRSIGLLLGICSPCYLQCRTFPKLFIKPTEGFLFKRKADQRKLSLNSIRHALRLADSG